MKFINGVPQFEIDEVVICVEKLPNGLEVPDVDHWVYFANCAIQNEYAKRTCVNCKYIRETDEPGGYCAKLGLTIFEQVEFDKFHCAAWEQK